MKYDVVVSRTLRKVRSFATKEEANAYIIKLYRLQYHAGCMLSGYYGIVEVD